MRSEQPEKELLCGYCQSLLRGIEPLIIREAGYPYPEASAITRTHVCDSCGASLTSRKSPASGDCLLEVPKEYEFALDKFMRRIELLPDFEDLDSYPYGAHQPMECILVQNSDFKDGQAHDEHGDGFEIQLCNCSRVTIHFDGHITFRVEKERDTPFDPYRKSYYSDHNEAFEDLRHKLDNLLFGSMQFNQVQGLIATHLESTNHPFFCSGGPWFSRVVTWGIIGEEMDYPDRYTTYSLPGTDDRQSGE